MREILFKAKRKDNGEWVQGYYTYTPEIRDRELKNIICREEHLIHYHTLGALEFSIDTYEVEIDPETICQYTGLKDKHGNKIWENDTLKCAVEDPCTGKIDRYFNCYVKYCKTTNAMGWYGIDERKVLNKIPPQQDYLEITGNRFD